MSSIVCHKVGMDDQNQEFGRALEHADVCDASESCSTIVFIVKA